MYCTISFSDNHKDDYFTEDIFQTANSGKIKEYVWSVVLFKHQSFGAPFQAQYFLMQISIHIWENVSMP